jgi:hypothetical protein
VGVRGVGVQAVKASLITVARHWPGIQ